MHMDTGEQQQHQPETAVSYSSLHSFRSGHRCTKAAVFHPLHHEVHVGCKAMSIQYVLEGGLSYALKVHAEAQKATIMCRVRGLPPLFTDELDLVPVQVDGLGQEVMYIDQL